MSRGWDRVNGSLDGGRVWVLALGLVLVAGCGKPEGRSGGVVGAEGRTNAVPRAATNQAMFTVPVYDPEKPGRVVAMLSSTMSRLALSSQQLLDTVRLDYYDAEGRTNLTMTGTNCIFDGLGRVASSPGAMRVRSGDGQLDLEGVGFTWWQTNRDMVLSNRVVTIVRRGEGQSRPSPLRVESGSFRYNYQSNLIVYRDGVKVEDARMRLRCRVLTLVRAGNTFERIVAEGGVEVEEVAGAGRATGRQAVYVLTGGEETVELTGEPRWEGGGRMGSADRFVLDRKRDVLRAVGAARLVVPAGGGIGGVGFPMFGGGGVESSPAAGGRLVEVSAEAITFQLPATNGPVRSVVAETNVVIVDRERGGRLTARRAEYGEGEWLEVMGSPVWVSGEQRVSGGGMRFDVRQGAFTVEPDARVRFAVGALGPAVGSDSVGSGGKGAAGLTNHFVEVWGPRLEWRGGWLRIGEGVEAEYRVGGDIAGRLRCRSLGVQYSNRVEQVTAAGEVVWEQAPQKDGRGGLAVRTGRCESLRVGFDGEGNLREAEVGGGVTVEERVRGAKGGAESVRRLRCRELVAGFAGPPYRVAGALATGGVKAGEGERTLESEQARYDGASGWLESSGHPVVTLAEGRVWDATTVGWEPATGKYRVSGSFNSIWKALPKGTNLHRLLEAK